MRSSLRAQIGRWGSAVDARHILLVATAVFALALVTGIVAENDSARSPGTAKAAGGAAVVAAAPLAVGTHNDTAFTYTGSWKRTRNSTYYQSDDHRTGAAGKTFQLSFDGTQAKIYALKASRMGIMRVSLDGGASVDVDLYSPSPKAQTLVYATSNLTAGVHTITVTVTGTKNPAASGKLVNADRADILGPTAGPTPTPTTEPTATPTSEPTTGSFHAFSEVTVTTEFSVAGAGQNIDTIAFWEAPSETDSLMFVTSKSLSLVEVWRYPFNSAATEMTALTHSCLEATADSATNGVIVDQESDLLYVASNWSPNVCVFSLPDLTHRLTITSGVSYGLEPNLAQMKLPDGSKRLYVSNNNVVFVHDATTGEKISQFSPAKGLETMWGDSFDQVLYIPDENGRTGVYAYNPDGSTYTRNGTNIIGNNTVFNSDEEGILEYTCPSSGVGDNGTGLIVVSDQIDSSTVGNDYEVFDRRTWAHLGKIQLRPPGGTGYISNTDGIASTQRSSPQYSHGLFTAIHDDTSVAGVGWKKIFDAISAETGKTFGC